MSIPPIAALEIGTTNTVMCIGEDDGNGHVRLLGVGKCPTSGVRKGEIYDLQAVRGGIERAAKEAEEKAAVDIGKVFLVLSDGQIATTRHHGAITLRTHDSTITQEDIDEVKHFAHESPVDEQRQVLHTLELAYSVDGVGGITNPLGMNGRALELDAMSIHAKEQAVSNAVNAVKEVRFDVEDVTFAGVCAGLAVLTEEERRNGVILIDLGGGTTTYMAYANSFLALAGSLGIGGDHVTNDIALAFTFSQKQAEEIKKTKGGALLEAEDGKRFAVSTKVGFEERIISCKAINTVINARMDETFRVLRGIFDQEGLLSQASRGIVLTGGGAYLKQVAELASRVFGLPCRVARLNGFDGVADQEEETSLACVAGLVKYGILTYRSSHKLSWFRKLWGRR